MNFDLNNATIFLTLSGSRAYGIANLGSDWDYRGICIPPHKNYFVGNTFEQAVDTDKSKHVWKNFPQGTVQPNADMQVMELTKFTRLALDNNPSVLEILFSDPQDIIRQNPIIEPILNAKHLFLSKRSKARFAGYGVSQLKRIERHKRWLDNPPVKPPERKDFGLPDYGIVSADQLGAAEALIKREVDNFMVDQNDLPEHTKIDLTLSLERILKQVWGALHTEELPIGKERRFSSTEEALMESAMIKEGFDGNFIEILKKERKYRAAKQEWDSYQHWLSDRNPARAAIEKKYGFDLKHAAHCYRLLSSAREILEHGTLHVKRPDADILRAIRRGEWTYEQICDFAEKELMELNELCNKSKLPSHPDVEKINDIVYTVIQNFHQR